MGYSSTALASPNVYQVDLPPALVRDLRQIYLSGEHLLRVINDLLDLSRAEINELDLFPETIQARTFLTQTFQDFGESRSAKPGVAWLLELPDDLPLISGRSRAAAADSLQPAQQRRQVHDDGRDCAGRRDRAAPIAYLGA